MRQLAFATPIVCVALFLACTNDEPGGAGPTPGAEAGSPEAASQADGGSEAATPSDSGDTPDSSDGSAPEGGDGTLAKPPNGRAKIKATFSNPSGDYNGDTGAFDGAGATPNNEADDTGSNLSFRDRNGPNDRTVSVNISTSTPVVGQTYNTSSVSPIVYQQGIIPNPSSLRYWICPGTITVDKIEGSTYWFSFTGACTKNTNVATSNSAVGTVTITGVGVGTL